MRKNTIEYHMPPGLDIREERNFFLFGLCCAFVYNMLFFVSYSSALNDLYGWDHGAGKRVLLSEAVMVDFAELYDHLEYGFIILALCMIGFVIRHYLYYRQDAKSIYLVRRLPKKFDYHRRALTLPLCGAVICLIAAAIMLVICFGVYMLFTPDECLRAGQWMMIWR